MIEITCACGCGRKRLVRKADRARGWGRFYSKSCKAREQTKRTGRGRPRRDPDADQFPSMEPGYLGHGQS